MKRIRKDDQVIVIAGKSKNQTGKVLRVFNDYVIVEGCNLIKKHVKANPQQPENKGGIISREALLHVSNVAHYNPVTKKADKIGYKFIENGDVTKKVRFYKSNNELVDRI